MTNYETVKINLSKNQKAKLISAKRNGRDITLTLKSLDESGNSPEELALTKTQINKLQKAYPKAVRIHFSATQIQSQTGGFLSAILPFLTKTILPALGKIGLSAASGAVSGLAESATRGKGLYKGKPKGKPLNPSAGKGLYKVGDEGKGLYRGKPLNPSAGKGLYKVGDGIFPLSVTKNEMKHILNTISEIEKAGIVKNGTLKSVMNEIKEQKGGFLGALLAGLAGTLLPSLLSGLSKN